jgi:hypothetical protein
MIVSLVICNCLYALYVGLLALVLLVCFTPLSRYSLVLEYGRVRVPFSAKQACQVFAGRIVSTF